MRTSDELDLELNVGLATMRYLKKYGYKIVKVSENE
jgi:hypothetical protein